MEKELEWHGIVWVAFFVVMAAAIVLGMEIENIMKPASPTIGLTNAKYADITLTVIGGSTLGPDNKTHDAFVPCNFTVYAGQIINLTVVNYDNSQHSFTSPSLNVNFLITASQEIGVPSVSHF